MMNFRRLLWTAALAAASTGAAEPANAAAGSAESGSAKSGEPRTVLAHYMTCFTGPEELCRREIKLARRYGIDGFAQNCGEWKKLDAKGNIVDTGYVRNADRMFKAAADDGNGFKLCFSADFAGKMIRTLPVLNVGDMIARYYKHPNAFRYQGKYFISSYGGTPLQFEAALKTARAEGFELCVVPTGGFPQYPMMLSYEKILDQFKAAPEFDGLFRFFVCDNTVADNLRGNALLRRVTQYLGKLYMAGVSPAYNSSNYRDFMGLRGYSATWEGIVRDRPDFVEIVTWNDYHEDSNLMPHGTRYLRGKRYFDRDESYLDVTKYYADFYRTGVRPEIEQERVYLTYRTRLKDQTRVWNETTKKWDDLRFNKGMHIDQLHDDVRDLVYVTAFLKLPAVIEIVQGKQVVRVERPAGIVHAEAPMVPGETPRVRLLRDGKSLLDFTGRRSIVKTPTPANSVQAGALAHRTWTNGAAVGHPTFTFDLKDRPFKIPNAEEVMKLENPGDTPYCFLLTYRNTGREDARLTLYADGLAENAEAPTSIPMFLPPTGNEFRTVSVLWSLWPETTTLRLRRDSSIDKKYARSDFNDFGEATVRKLELVPVRVFASRPAPAWKHPELVSIPGGEFTMGGPGGAADELPARKVKLSPFAIGQYEVTNEEFEKFMPEHRKMRDGYSWRDREPALFVSWRHAAAYCNWLSQKNSLTPAYDEKTWKLVPGADGFRLPTEAEWEYVATGRGENRLYPWGNDRPVAGKHGNFSDNPLDDSQLSAMSGGGARCVGDFPEGASRDGVLDLAGNAAEWCTDTFLPYPADNAESADPVCETDSPFRVIRGGSWGYYNGSQRSRDREFNSPGYPGYIYLGFRVALPNAGYTKLLAAEKAK